MKRVSFQGERGAYSEAASLSFFGNEIEAIPCFTFADVLKNTENDVSDYSILPVENSLEGSIGESNRSRWQVSWRIPGRFDGSTAAVLFGIRYQMDVDSSKGVYPYSSDGAGWS